MEKTTNLSANQAEQSALFIKSEPKLNCLLDTTIDGCHVRFLFPGTLAQSARHIAGIIAKNKGKEAEC
jgi:hypothetical protein